VTPTRRFTAWETTSGLPEDSQKADEREEQRRLRDFRARANRARAVVAATPGVAELLANDRRQAARFYSQHRVSRRALRQSPPAYETFVAASQHAQSG
jgi:hypothetical protein